MAAGRALGTWRSRILGSTEEDPTQLLANPRNWRTHPAGQRRALRGSLDTVGWVQQVLVNKATGNVVDGHARIEEAISRGEPKVPVLWVDLSPEEEALVLATLDPIAAMADQDEDRLRALLAEVSVDDEGLQALLDDLAPRDTKAGLTDPDDVPEDADASGIARGDLFALGDHRLMCGDGSDAGDLARLMGADAAVCVWTDPPYGVAYVGKTKKALTIKNDEGDQSGLVGRVFTALLAHVAPGAPFYCAGPAGPRMLPFFGAIAEAGWKLHEELVWVKDVFVLGHSDYHYRHEPIFYGYAPGPGRSGRGDHEGSRWYGDHSQSTVLEVPRPKRSEEHPTMKPVALVTTCLANSAPQGGVVLDPFSGSGTTIMACEQMCLRARAMEIDPRYVAVAVRRWEEFTGRKAERL